MRPLLLPGPEATEALGRWLAPHLSAGDTLLLTGPVGAGKSALARALIRERQRLGGVAVEEVPSPSFSLVQTYWDGATEIWHADLYRLGGSADLQELGLEDAFTDAICLIEWPERMASPPPAALTLRLTPDASGETRALSAESTHPRWQPLLAALPQALP